MLGVRGDQREESVEHHGRLEEPDSYLEPGTSWLLRQTDGNDLVICHPAAGFGCARCLSPAAKKFKFRSGEELESRARQQVRAESRWMIARQSGWQRTTSVLMVQQPSREDDSVRLVFLLSTKSFYHPLTNHSSINYRQSNQGK